MNCPEHLTPMRQLTYPLSHCDQCNQSCDKKETIRKWLLTADELDMERKDIEEMKAEERIRK